jgi:Patatin-like phospholipase
MLDPTPDSTALPHEVHAEELRTISARRLAAGLDADTPIHPESGDALEAGEPSTRRGLIGLAISGGGIRSSTFSLGVLQALAKRGIFKRFDYISTVSGGGYTGSMLSSLLRDPCDAGPDGDDFPLAKEDGEEESAALEHLRNGSNYLDPGGLLNTVRLPAVVLRGLLLNLLMMLPYLMILVGITEYVHENSYRLAWVGPSMIERVDWFRDDLWSLVALAPILIVVYYALGRLNDADWKGRNRYERALGFFTILFAGAILIAIPVWKIVTAAIQYPLYGPNGLTGFIGRHLGTSVWLMGILWFAGAYALVKASEQISRIVSKTLLYGAALAGPGILFGMYLLLLIAQVDSPILSAGFKEFSEPRSTTSVQTMTLAQAREIEVRLASDIAPGTPEDHQGRAASIIRTYLDSTRTEGSGASSQDTIVTAMTLILSDSLRQVLAGKGIYYPASRFDSATYVPAIACQGPGIQDRTWNLAQDTLPKFAAAEARPSLTICSLPENAMEESLYYRFTRHGDDYMIAGAKLRLSGERGDQTLVADDIFLVLAILIWLFNLVFFDVNKSSLHSFYRDRLSRLYLFRKKPDGTPEPNDEQKLSELNAKGSVAPYHIINTTLNLQGEEVVSVRGRSSDFFMFSKHFCGGNHTGYCPTTDMERWDPHVDLGTAMAISAAAAAPNMGSTTKKSMAFILTMLNFRLGYWLPHPNFVNEHKRLARFRPLRPGTPSLLREALGMLNARGRMVNVSDGGHLENLAIYELLRRRCKLIVAIDGEADPELTFHGLVTLVRIVKIDLGIDIDIQLDDLEWREDRTTSKHFAIGTIDYGKDGKGTFVYVKSSFCDDENLTVQKYRDDHPDFPHETTADQFFDEIQFEAYRELGAHVGEDVVAHARGIDLAGFEQEEAGFSAG